MTDEAQPVRPTFRALTSDLAEEVGPPSLRLAFSTFTKDQAKDPNHLLPVLLADTEHPILEKARHIASDASAPRERIQKFADRVVVKVKSGPRRGAIWQDDTDQWWLLAAGRRKDDGPGDFYRSLGSESDGLIPTARDIRYQKLEVSYANECAAEQTAQLLVIDALIDAASQPGRAVQVSVFGAVLSVRIDLDEFELAVLELSWVLLEFDQQDRFPADVLAMIPGLEDVDDWVFLPPLASAQSPHAWQALITLARVTDLATSAEIQHLLRGANAPPASPTSNGSEHFSHWASQKAVTMAYVTGIEIVGICGARVVAYRDYERFPICNACDEVLALLRLTGHA